MLFRSTAIILDRYPGNNLAPHVFTPSRIAVLKLLAWQAATSLENIRLWRDLEAREARIRRLVDANIIGIWARCSKEMKTRVGRPLFRKNFLTNCFVTLRLS